MVLVSYSKRTQVYLIALKAITKLGPVDLEESPIFGETLLTDTKD